MDMKSRRTFWLGVLWGVSLAGCASFTSVRYYGLDGMDYSKGTLLGPTPMEDIPFVKCSPTDVDKSPCVILTASEFFRLRRELEETKAKLQRCEQE